MKGVIPAPRVAYAHNLLDNSDFRNPINQRGQRRYNSGAYTIDRWFLWSGDDSAGMDIEDGGIAINSPSSTWTLSQRYAKGVLKGAAYTLAY